MRDLTMSRVEILGPLLVPAKLLGESQHIRGRLDAGKTPPPFMTLELLKASERSEQITVLTDSQ
jgi:hypothetical protein